MPISARTLKWLMRFYPPLLVSRIWVVDISDDFHSARVKVFKSMLNINFNRSIFGGSIYCAADPFFAILLWGVFHQKGIKTRVWLKSASVQFIKPAHTDLLIDFTLDSRQLMEAEDALNRTGKFIHTFSVQAVDKLGAISALINTEVYVRKIETSEK